MIVFLSFLCAFILVMLRLPEWLLPYQPDWVALVMIYWVLALPQRMGPAIAWAIGLLVDVMHANLLGIHALGMALLAYLTYRAHPRMRVFPGWQQALTVFALLVIYRAATGWIRGFVTPLQLDYSYWLPCIVGALAWPLLFALLRDARRFARQI